MTRILLYVCGIAHLILAGVAWRNSDLATLHSGVGLALIVVAGKEDAQ